MSGKALTNWTMKTVMDRCNVEGECWIWAQSLTSTGHPQASINGKNTPVRRWVASQNGFTLTRAHRLVSTCGDNRCCNPAHMRTTSYSQVLKHSYKIGTRNTLCEYRSRYERAAKNGWVKMTPEQVQMLRSLPSSVPHTHAARMVGVHHKTAANIRKGKTHRMHHAGCSVFNL